MISIKELRIGNHVLLDGERVEIDEISISGQVGCITQDNDWLGVDANDRLDPIPITEELLKELGFEKYKEGWIDDIKQDYPIFIKIKSHENKNYVSVGGSSLFFKYLHEFETFVYMTTKKELI